MKDLFNKKINRKNTDSIKWDCQGNEFNLPFWIADSDYQTAPAVLDALSEVSKIGAYGYNQVPQRFNKSIIKWYKERFNSTIESEWIVPTTGVILELRVMLDALTKPGDGVILQTPVYHTFHHLLNEMNLNIVENKLIRKNDTYFIDYDNLECLFKQGHRYLILCSPHNPVGRMWTYEEIESIILLAKKYDVFLIVDEIHSDLNINDRPFVSATRFLSIYDKMAICNAPSKTFNIAGLHTAYIILANKIYRENFIKRYNRDFLAKPSVFGYAATIAAYENGAQWVEAQNIHIKKNYEYLKNYLNENLPQVVVTKLEATYLVWLDFSYTKYSSEKLMEKLNNAGVTCSEGKGFSKDYDAFVRFNIACPLDQLKEGLERIVKVFK